MTLFNYHFVELFWYIHIRIRIVFGCNVMSFQQSFN